jgi:hypothetical protein
MMNEYAGWSEWDFGLENIERLSSIPEDDPWYVEVPM